MKYHEIILKFMKLWSLRNKCALKPVRILAKINNEPIKPRCTFRKKLMKGFNSRVDFIKIYENI